MMKQRQLAWIPALGAVLLLGTGCGGSTDDNGGGGATGPTFQDATNQVVDAYCSVMPSCYGPWLDKNVTGLDCKSDLGPGIVEGSFAATEQDIADGKVIYHPDKVAACIEAIKKQGCDGATQRGPAECEEVFEGTVAENGACKTDAQCKGDLTCKTGAQCPGTCVKRLKEGEACGEDDNCESGLSCGEKSGKCEIPAKEGENCDAPGSASCGVGLMCFGATTGKPGTCAKFEDMFKGAAGDPCDIQKGPWCQTSAACVITSVNPKVETKCEARVASGAACKFGVLNPCPVDEYCNADIKKGKVDGTCTKLPVAGESCLSEGGTFFQCKPGLVCDKSDKCQAKQHIGGSCTEDDVCFSGNCDGGKCQPGDACSAWKN